MEDLLEPAMRFSEVRVEEALEDGEIPVEVIAGDRQGDATRNEADNPDCVPHPGPILSSVLSQYDSPAGK